MRAAEEEKDAYRADLQAKLYELKDAAAAEIEHLNQTIKTLSDETMEAQRQLAASTSKMDPNPALTPLIPIR